ncbi:MAG TPA: Clp protease N-terminal domain-containing protein [Solirubrobacteraceae bacterium]|nr:Clp protease N-terminal domain-containing protein [Solirubrobacteraceae bacterium]
MNGGEATIEQLAREVVQITDPDTAIRALTALRQELDATEPELVLRALQDGASWSQVARALGITKQAAHRKYRFLFEHAITVPTTAKLQVTGEARRAIQYARQESKRLSQPAVGTEHILLGILRCDRSAAAKALNAVGVTLERARACLHTTLPGLPPEQVESADTDGISQQARRILERSVREAVQRGDGHIGVEHLLLALLVDSRNGAVQTLEDLKTAPARVKRQLEFDWPAAAPALPPEEQPTMVHVTSRRRPVSTS